MTAQVNKNEDTSLNIQGQKRVAYIPWQPGKSALTAKKTILTENTSTVENGRLSLALRGSHLTTFTLMQAADPLMQEIGTILKDFLGFHSFYKVKVQFLRPNCSVLFRHFLQLQKPKLDPPS